MKNKVVSAMLVGMSVTMAMPGAAIFAAEDTSAMEEVTAGGQADDMSGDTAGQLSEGGVTEPEGAAEPEEAAAAEDEIPTPEEMTADMVAYASDEAAKVADTPSDFSSKLASLSFDKAVFGKYATSLTEFMGNGVDKSSLYNCELSVAKKAAELAAGDGNEVIRAMKYAVATEFEKVYGEDAFQAGRDIRRAIITDMSIDKDYEFAVSEDIASADDVYVAAGGNTLSPADLLPEESEEEKKALYEYVMGMTDMEVEQGKSIERPNLVFDTTYVTDVTLDTTQVDCNTPGIYKIAFVITGADGSTMRVEKNCTVKAAETPGETPDPGTAPDPGTNPNPGEGQTPEQGLENYVTGMTDISMEAGDSIPSVDLNYDTTYVSGVTLDTSAVNTGTVGVYKIVYVITGVDGKVVNVEKTCTVSENSEIVELRIQMCAAVDALGQDKFTVEEFQKKWDEAAASAKAQINQMQTQEDMQGAVDAAAKAADSILAEQQLYIAKQGYVKILKEYRDSFTYETDALKAKADAAADAGITDIQAADSVDDASAAMESAKENIRKIGEQDAEVIDELKTDALDKINEIYAQADDSYSIPASIRDAAITRLGNMTKAKEIESLVNTVDRAFADAGTGLKEGDMSILLQLFRDLKGLAADADTTAVIEKVIGLGQPDNEEVAENRVSDICAAITNSTEDFAAYLTARAGKPVAADTKADAYTKYLELTNGVPDESLKTAKEAAKKEVKAKLDAIQVSTEALRARRAQVQQEADALIDAAADEAGVQTALSQALAKVTAFADEAAASEGLKEAKASAKKEIQAIVETQPASSNVRPAVEALAQTANTKIDAAASADEINTIIATFKSDVELAAKQDAENEALTTAKVEYLNKLNSLTEGVKPEYLTEDINTLLLQAKAKIGEAKSADECASIYEQTKASYKDTLLVTMRNAYTAKLDALMTDNTFNNEDIKAKAQEVVDKQKENLSQAKNEETMQKCFELAQSSIQTLKEADANTDLTKVKADAITKLKNGYNSLTEQQSKILTQYLNKINAATSEDEVNTLVSQCENAMQEAGAQKSDGSGSGSGSGTTDLATVKADAISSLTNMAATAPEANKEAAQKILKEYTDKINAATTADQVNQLKEEGIKALSKYGADSNAAKPNGNTSTTVGGSSDAGASEKAVSTNTVKTGDENMGIIAAAGAAFVTAIAAAFIAIKKFIKK